MLRYLAIRVLWVLGILLAMTIMACSDGAKSKAVDAIKDAQGQTSAQAGTLNDLGNTAGVKSDAKAGALTNQAKGQNRAIAKDLGVAKPAAQDDANEAAAADNAVVVRLTGIGIGLFVLGVAAGLAGILASTSLGGLAAHFRTGGIIVAGTGIAALYVAYHWSAFNKALNVVVIGGVLLGIVWVVVHYVSASEVTAVEAWIVNLFGKAVKGIKSVSTRIAFGKPAPKRDVA